MDSPGRGCFKIGPAQHLFGEGAALLCDAPSRYRDAGNSKWDHERAKEPDAGRIQKSKDARSSGGKGFEKQNG